MPTLEEKLKSLTVVEEKIVVQPDPPEYQQRQRRTMVVALCLLLVALAVVIIRDRDFWFPPSGETEAEVVEPETDSTAESQGAPVVSESTTVNKNTKGRKKPPPPALRAAPAAAAPAPAVIAERRALPPLQIEIVAGDVRKTIHPGNNSVKVELHGGVPAHPAAQEASVQSPVSKGPAVNVSEQVRLSPETAQAVSRPVSPDYPMLARQMKVQGSVILEALIGKDGTIQDLRVVSGPAILAAAAREAVKQWRFKPYLQEGQPIETEARITVNFTISTS